MTIGLKANVDGTSGAVQVNGNDVVTVNSSGNVGIGTSSPGVKLDVRGDVTATNATNGVTLGTTDGNIELFNSASTAYIDFKTNTLEDYDCRVQTLSNGLAFFTGGNGAAAERVRIDSAGNVGIGTNNPGVKLDVNGVVRVAQGNGQGVDLNAAGSGYVYGTSGDNATSTVANVRIASWFGIGFSPSISGQTVPQWENAVWINCRNGDIGGRGSLTMSGNVTAYSDARVKENVNPIIGALGKVAQLNGYTYTRTDLEDKERVHAGLIAQEIERVLPEAVFDNGELKAVDYNATIALLVEAIKELRTEVAELKGGR